MPKFFYPCLAMFVAGVVVGNISQTDNETKVRDAIYHECVKDFKLKDAKWFDRKTCIRNAYN